MGTCETARSYGLAPRVQRARMRFVLVTLLSPPQAKSKKADDDADDKKRCAVVAVWCLRWLVGFCTDLSLIFPFLPQQRVRAAQGETRRGRAAPAKASQAILAGQAREKLARIH